MNHPGWKNVDSMNELNQHMQQFANAGIPKIEYPKHWSKGQELCNRTACQTGRNVIYYNHSTKAYYCPKCARLINNGNGTINGVPLCSIDEHKYEYEKNYKMELSYEEYKESSKLFTF